MELKGVITAAKMVKRVANIVVDTDGVGKKRKRRILKYLLSEIVTERDVLKHVGKSKVRITIFGDMIYNIWPD